jgi:hypothetical protein
MADDTTVEGGADSSAMAKDGDTALPRDKTGPEGDLAPAEKDVPEDEDLDAGGFIEKDEVLTPDSDPEDAMASEVHSGVDDQAA